MNDSVVLAKFKDNMEKYASNFSVDGLWQSIKKYSKKLGCKLVYDILKLYFLATDGNVSPCDKAVIFAALGYFILPIDILPDFMPGGLIDDGIVLRWAMTQVNASLSIESKIKILALLEIWFPGVDLAELD